MLWSLLWELCDYPLISTCILNMSISKHTRIEYILSRVTILLTKILKTKGCYIIFTSHESWRKNGVSLWFIVYWKLIYFWCTQNIPATKVVDFAVYIRNTWDGKIIHSKNIYDKNLYNIKTFFFKKGCIFSCLKVLYVHRLEIINE